MTKVIVSLTTIASRVQLLPTVLQGILAQGLPPDIVYVNVSDHPLFLDSGIELDILPPEVRRMAVDGTIRLTFGPNHGPYRKLLPALARHRHEDCVLVTADDDVMYPPRWLGGLVEAHQQTGHITAYRCRAMRFDPGSPLSYSRWERMTGDNSPNFGAIRAEFQSLFTLPTGRGGVLYRPEFFPDAGLLAELRQRAPLQDDLGFKVATLLQKIPVTVVPPSVAGIDGKDFAKAGGARTSLHKTNTKGPNTEAIRALFEFVIERKLFSWDLYTTSPQDHL